MLKKYIAMAKNQTEVLSWHTKLLMLALCVVHVLANVQ
jgi:hypothetical protein